MNLEMTAVLSPPAAIPAPVYPVDAPLSGLRTPELLLVATFRLFAAAHCDNSDDLAWQAGLIHSGAGHDAVVGFNGLFGIVVAAARRSLDVRCPHCPGLSRDEGRLLQIVSLLQQQRGWAARDVLSDWLPPAAARFAIQPARELALALSRVGLTIPPRHCEAGRQTHAGSALLH